MNALNRLRLCSRKRLQRLSQEAPVKLLGGQLLFTKVTKIVFRRVSSLEEDLEKTEEKMLAAASKLDKASTACDDSERAKKVERYFVILCSPERLILFLPGGYVSQVFER